MPEDVNFFFRLLVRLKLSNKKKGRGQLGKSNRYLPLPRQLLVRHLAILSRKITRRLSIRALINESQRYRV